MQAFIVSTICFLIASGIFAVFRWWGIGALIVVCWLIEVIYYRRTGRRLG